VWEEPTQIWNVRATLAGTFGNGQRGWAVFSTWVQETPTVLTFYGALS
jgi:hypothetical protein